MIFIIVRKCMSLSGNFAVGIKPVCSNKEHPDMPEIEIPSLNKRLSALSRLGEMLSILYNDESLPKIEGGLAKSMENFRNSIIESGRVNPWFTPENIKFAIEAWSEALTVTSLNQWILPYQKGLRENHSPKKVAVIMAGNIPLVGMHDFISTLLAGHFFIGKLSVNDNLLLPALAKLLVLVEPGFERMISFTDQKLENFDAVIATGSNNTSRYFEYYFSKYPHIIRKNRNGVAVLDGTESNTSLQGLASDICLYFGLGCRSISKIYIPEGFNPAYILDACEPFRNNLFDHFKYMNNYIYQKTILQINLLPFYDNGVILLFDSTANSSPISVVHFETYRSAEALQEKLLLEKELIQCIASDSLNIPGSVPLGATQRPGLWDYADGIDTLEFLLSL